MLNTMRKAIILISAIAFGAFGLFAQDELATYQTSMRAAAAAANDAMRGALTGNDTAAVSAKAKDMSAAFDTIAAFWKAKGKDDAVKLAEAASAAGKAAAAATTSDDQKAAMGRAGANCLACHALYRDGNKFKGL
jgi:cytochrome c556